MIGGEFEIDLSLQRNDFASQSDTYYYASGRTALYQILRSLASQHHKIWLPDWLCHTMVEAVIKAGLDYCFYELDEHLMATLNALDKSGFKDGNLVLMVNYFGLQDLNKISKTIKKEFPNAVVIEDDVQAYWVFAEKNNPYADYSFTSLRKAFAIPDGGLVYTQRSMTRATQPNTFAKYKIEAGVMKMRRGEHGIKDEDYLALFEKGSELIDDDYNSVMSRDSEMLFAGTDFERAKQQRKENARYLLEGLKSLDIKPMIEVSENMVPLFVPIYLDDRNSIRKRMFQHEIYCPVHWPLEGMPLKKGAEMAQHELSLIVDQRYSINDMNLLLSFL